MFFDGSFLFKGQILRFSDLAFFSFNRQKMMSKVYNERYFRNYEPFTCYKPWSNCRDVLRPENSASLTSPDSSLCDVIAEEAIPS